MDYHPGDVVTCKVNYGKIVSSESADFEDILPFDIVGVCDDGLLLYVKVGILILNSFILNDRDCQQFNIPIKFYGSNVCYIESKDIINLKYRMQGNCCATCNLYCQYSEINRLDEQGNGIYICYSCRTNPYFK